VVTVGREEGRVVLTVENDGAEAAGGTGGSGLAGLRERLTAVDGTLAAGRTGDTFRLVAEVPADTAGTGPLNAPGDAS
jgi:two-component system sensor histidine kinase DesK